MPKFQPALSACRKYRPALGRARLCSVGTRGLIFSRNCHPRCRRPAEANKRRGSHRTQSSPTFRADDPEDGCGWMDGWICVKRQWSKLRAPVWLGFEASDAAAAPLGGGEPGSWPLTNLRTTKKKKKIPHQVFGLSTLPKTVRFCKPYTSSDSSGALKS